MRAMAFASAILFTCGSAFAQTPIRTTPEACAQLAQLQVAGVALTVVKAAWVEAGAPMPGGRAGAPPVATQLPAYCRLDGVIDRRTGAAGTTYGIGFALAMPENWNGRFLFQGGGGLNGSVQPPLGGSAAGGTPGLARGFAVVSTDTGHQGRGGFDASFMQDQQASLDFAYAAVGRVAELSKRIIAQHYGTPPVRSYFAGCSTGGREAMLMAQRYPLLLRRRRRGRPGHAHQLLGHRRSMGRRDAERDRAEERTGPAGDAGGALGPRQADRHGRVWSTPAMPATA